MAVEPTFIASMDALKSQLRMTGAKQTDALAILDSLVQKARAYLIESLGEDRVVELRAIPYTENPLTASGASRLRANSLELALVKLEALRALPVTFMDSKGAAQERWNEEGLLRKEESARQDEIERLQEEISASVVALLPEEEDPVAGGSIRAQTFEPETKPTLAASVFSTAARNL